MTVVTFVSTIVTWMYVRNYCFTSIIYSIHTGPDPFESKPHLIDIFVFLLSCLCILHYYWVAMFFKILYVYATKGEAEDTQN